MFDSFKHGNKTYKGKEWHNKKQSKRESVKGKMVFQVDRKEI